MLALYRSGRQAEALQAYQDARKMLVDELGIEPTPALQQLHASILRQESALQPQVFPAPARTGRARSSARCSPAGSCTSSGQARRRRTGRASPAASRGVRLPRRASRRPDAGLAVCRRHARSRPAVRPAARALRRGRRARAGRALPRRALPSWLAPVSAEHQLLVTTAYGALSSARSRSAEKRSTSSRSSRSARTEESSSTGRPTAPRRSSPSRTPTRSSRWPSGR